MPNLKDFLLDCTNNEVTENFYKTFISKLWSMNLKYICFSIKNNDENKIENESVLYSLLDDDNELYGENELKKINPNINYSQYDDIKIKKFKNKI